MKTDLNSQFRVRENYKAQYSSLTDLVVFPGSCGQGGGHAVRGDACCTLMIPLTRPCFSWWLVYLHVYVSTLSHLIHTQAKGPGVLTNVTGKQKNKLVSRKNGNINLEH